MKLSEISQETSLKTLNKWLLDADFWVWNAKAEGSARGEKLWTTRKNAILDRISAIETM